MKRLEFSFDSRGLMSGALQKNSSGTVLDEISCGYDGWGAMNAMTQDPDSAISGGSGRGSFAFTYTSAANTTSDTWQTLYLTQWTQPGSVSINPDYSTSSQDSKIRRISTLRDGSNTDLTAYQYMGVGAVAQATLVDPGVASSVFDYYASTGYTTYDTYLDRFNRPLKTQWMRDLGSSGVTFVDLSMTYDRLGNAQALSDAVLLDAQSAAKRTFEAYTLRDALSRLINREEGELNTGKTAIDSGAKARAEDGPRNLAGRITRDKVDLNGDGDFTDGPLASAEGGEMDDIRTYNKRNELRSRSVLDKDSPTTARTITLSYDENGNLTDDGENYEFLYDVFNRLVQVKKNTGAKPVVAKYTYNALGQRISEQYDCNRAANDGVTDGVTDSNDPTFYIACDRAGRRVATFRGTDSSPKETFVYHAAGLAHNGQQPDGVGPSFSGGVALRDRDAQNSDPTKWATTSASDRAERYEYCADARGSVMALVSASGALVEQYRYSPTGVPNGLPLGDLDTDGEVKGATGQADDLLVKNTTYQVRKDLNLDGVRDSADETIVTNQNGKKTGRGRLSRESVMSRKSYLGLESEVGREWVQSAGAVFGDTRLSANLGSMGIGRRPGRGGELDGAPTSGGSPAPTWVPCNTPIPWLNGWMYPCCSRQSEEPEWCNAACSNPDAAGGTWCITDNTSPLGTWKVCCVCDTNITNAYPASAGNGGGPGGAELISTCAAVHEGVHLGQRCIDSGDTTTAACAEVPAFQAEYACLVSALTQCSNDLCKKQVINRMAAVAKLLKQKRSECNGAAPVLINPDAGPR